jgi:hypothetical protein
MARPRVSLQRPVPTLLLLAGLAQGYNLYYANLHSHTSYSDGVSTPAHAFAYARDTAHIQVLAVTDHGEGLDSVEWSDVRAQADSATIPGRFVGIAGFEWTTPLGHANVLFTSDYTTRFACPNPTVFYHWLLPRLGLGQFNHPGAGSFDSFAYSAPGDSRIALCEMQNPAQALTYRVALDSGWHVGMAANQDNHSANWGAGSRLTGVYAGTLTREGIEDALRRMRTFGTLDRNAWLRFTANDSLMGSRIGSGPIHFVVEAGDADSAEGIAWFQILTNDNQVLATNFPGGTNPARWETTCTVVSTEERYFFVRVSETDGDTLQSSPVWTASDLGVADGGEPRVQPGGAATVVRGVLYLDARLEHGPDSPEGNGSGPCLLNIAGRRAMELRQGANDVRGLSPGVYFVRSRSGVGRVVLLK